MTGKNNTIAFQGFTGAYSDMACRAVYPGWNTLPCHSFEDAFAAVEKGDAGLAMIPVDNTLAGRVADVHHLLPAGKLHIIGEHFQPINHYLLGVKGSKIGDLKHVHSHIHAIPQCRKIIKDLGLQSHVHADTAGAASKVARDNDKSQGAIASPLAAETYDLEILRKDVQDADHNTTRFLILSLDAITPEYNKSQKVLTSFVFRTRNIPAALYKALGGFATNGISMAKLESYVGEGFKVARFYAEVEGHPESRALKLALEELDFYAEEVRIMGTYPTHEFRTRI